MPNWCNNNILISGPIAEIDRFCNDAEGERSHISLQALVPCPQELTDVTSGGEEPP
jgi:hypothetical protein